mgnify:CR=1 FL=1
MSFVRVHPMQERELAARFHAEIIPIAFTISVMYGAKPHKYMQKFTKGDILNECRKLVQRRPTVIENLE